MQGKIELTPAESNMMIGMYESIYKQHLRDMQGIYTKERRFEANYWWLKIGFKPDRICFYIKWEQCTVEYIDELKQIANKYNSVPIGIKYKGTDPINSKICL